MKISAYDMQIGTLTREGADALFLVNASALFHIRIKLFWTIKTDKKIAGRRKTSCLQNGYPFLFVAISYYSGYQVSIASDKDLKNI